MRQLVDQNQVPRVESDDYYNFVDGARIKRIAVDAAQRGQLNRGELRIVRCDHRYALVPAAAAARIGERDPAALIAPVAAETAVSDDGIYGAYVVPDDLTW